MLNAAAHRRAKALARIEAAAQNIARKLPVQPPYLQYEGPDQATVEAQQFEALADFLEMVAVAAPAQGIIHHLPHVDLPGLMSSENPDEDTDDVAE